VKTGSGILAIANDTRRICIAWRSAEVRQGDCFGVIGGMVKQGLTVEEGARLEMKEEVGYSGPIKLYAAYVLRTPYFEYHNFVGIVPNEFEFNPEPQFAFETDFLLWMDYKALVRSIQEEDLSDFHPGLVDLLRESKSLIEQFV
jgi:8-oxo-dGTP pyrophosphatase MutT (NUDIX family)